jgi:adenylate kinase family enzyme
MNTKSPMRVAIIGNSGSGKSTLAQALASARGLATLDLDNVAWEAGKVAVARDPAVAARDVRTFCEAREDWVVEGCYASLIEQALVYTPVLLFVDPGVDACVAHCRARPWEPHKYASKQEQDARLEFLLQWVRDYYVRDGELSRAAHEQLFDAYGGKKQRLISLPASDALHRWAQTAL